MADIFLLQKDGLIMHISKAEKVTKETRVSVPNNFYAFAIVDGKPMFNITSCEKLNVVDKYGSCLNNKEIQICYISMQTYEFMWGFGNAVINRSESNSCLFGANGTYQVRVFSPVKFYSAILHDMEQSELRNITIDFVKNMVESSYKDKLCGINFNDSELLGMGEVVQSDVNEKLFTYNLSNLGIVIENIRVNKTICNKKED